MVVGPLNSQLSTASESIWWHHFSSHFNDVMNLLLSHWNSCVLLTNLIIFLNHCTYLEKLLPNAAIALCGPHNDKRDEEWFWLASCFSWDPQTSYISSTLAMLFSTHDHNHSILEASWCCDGYMCRIAYKDGIGSAFDISSVPHPAFTMSCSDTDPYCVSYPTLVFPLQQILVQIAVESIAYGIPKS